MLDLTFEAPKPKVIAGAKHDWELVIGMEVHAQIASKAKLFSGASTQFGAEPNSNVAFVDVGTAAYSVSVYSVTALSLLVLCVALGVPLVGFSAQTWAMLLALTALAQLLGHTLLNRAVGTVGPVVVALVILLEVPAATVIAAAWLGQVPPLAALPAAALVLAGVALVVTSRPPGAEQPLPDA